MAQLSLEKWRASDTNFTCTVFALILLAGAADTECATMYIRYQL